jgi:hypothetical protein
MLSLLEFPQPVDATPKSPFEVFSNVFVVATRLPKSPTAAGLLEAIFVISVTYNAPSRRLLRRASSWHGEENPQWTPAGVWKNLVPDSHRVEIARRPGRQHCHNVRKFEAGHIVMLKR